jgi:hypothetical protein
MQTYSGLIFHPLDPKPGTIQIVDIAASLSKMCRFAGHCERFYSVAEHSVLLSRVAPKGYELTALLHDASEAYLVDIPRPLKPQLKDYHAIEYGLMEAIAKKFDFPWPIPKAIKDLDTAILSDERDQNMAHMDVPSQLWGNTLPALGVELQFWTPRVAQREFIWAFERYTGEFL